MTRTLEINQKTSIEAAYEYIELFGWQPIPIPYMSKNPGYKNWEKSSFGVEEVKTRFKGTKNIGILLGQPSNNLVDIDLDDELAIKLAPYFLPETDAVFGRQSKPSSHLFYYCKNIRTEKLTDINNQTIVEIRSNGGQTVVPPSTHPSGENIEWESYGEPSEIDKDNLHNAVSKLAAANILAKNWPSEGSRQDAALALSGGLFRAGWGIEEIEHFISAVTEGANDEEKEDREKTVKYTVETLREGEPATGWPRLMELIGKKPAKEVKRLLGVKSATLEQKREVDDFFIGKTFKPKLLADRICKEYSFKYAYKKIYVYKNGVFKPEGEKVIEKRATELLEEEYKSDRVNETVKYIKHKNNEEIPHYEEEYINVKNGRINWKEGKLEKHSPEVFEFNQLPVYYDPAADCPEFKAYLHSTLDENVIPLAQEIYGYCLLPYMKFEKAVMLKGSGANGKSVFLSTLQALLGGENVSNVELQELAESRFKAAELLGKKANIFTDIDARAMKQSSMFKVLVSGEEITAEEKFGDPFNFKNRAKLLFSANILPECSDNTYAFHRRWLIIPFNRTFTEEEADKELPDKLQTQEELSGILNWAIEGLCRLFKNDKFTEPEQVKEEAKKYRLKNDSVSSFIEEEVEINSESEILKDDFYQKYKQYCEREGFSIETRKAVTQKLKRIVPNLQERRNGRGGPRKFVGLKL